MSAPPPPPPSTVGSIPRKKITSIPQIPKICALNSANSFEVSNNIDWKNVRAISFAAGSGEESQGVILIETQIPNQVAVLKANVHLPGEIFSTLLAANHFGLASPKVRLLEYLPKGCAREENSEWSAVKASLPNLSDSKYKVEQYLNRPFFGLFEFVPQNHSLMDLYGSLDTLFTGDPLEATPYFLDVGVMIVMDVLINNFDRIPATIWQNNGNVGNILFSTALKRAVPIDHRVTAINNEKEKQNYLERVKTNFVQQVDLQQSKVQPALLNAIVTYLLSSLGIEAESPGEKKWEPVIRQSVEQGILKGMQHVHELNKEKLLQLKDQANDMKTGEDWQYVWEDGIHRIYIPFLVSVLEVMKTNSSQ